MPDAINLVTDVFAPHYVKTLRYEGDHPSRTLKLIPALIKSNFRITSTNFYEDEIKWDVSAEPIDFFGEWRGRSGIDARTAMWVKVKVVGKQNSKDKQGHVTIYIHPYMKTTIPLKGINGLIAPFYAHFFYKRQIKKFIEKRLLYFQRFEDDIKKELGIS
ncbi:hypothetical protein A3K64_04235 [Candidatus Micrarchaeota archaeon RBG_16_36_9]|nr:MAG: hypothetical protein A3K64_04235 [Candidatus Micrarchaeota archaeon RBG_16_36_9]